MFSNLSLMFKLNVVAIIFGEIWQLRECSSGAILLVFVDNRANFPTHTMHRSAVNYLYVLIYFFHFRELCTRNDLTEIRVRVEAAVRSTAYWLAGVKHFCQIHCTITPLRNFS